MLLSKRNMISILTSAESLFKMMKERNIEKDLVLSFNKIKKFNH